MREKIREILKDRGGCVAVFLVDYENVKENGLRGIQYLNKEDVLEIFYSDCCNKIYAGYMDKICQSGCDFHTFKLIRSGKNALDFYIATRIGEIFGKGYEGDAAIISRDKGYQAVSDFWKKHQKNPHTVVCSPDIEKGIMIMSSPKDKERRKILQEQMKMLNLGEEYVKYAQKKYFQKKMELLFKGTVYEDKTDQMMNLMDESEPGGKKVLYLNALKSFGRNDGREIYRKLKTIV